MSQTRSNAASYRHTALACSLAQVRAEVISSLHNLAMLSLMDEVSQIQADAMRADLEAILETIPNLPASPMPANQEEKV